MGVKYLGVAEQKKISRHREKPRKYVGGDQSVIADRFGVGVVHLVFVKE